MNVPRYSAWRFVHPDFDKAIENTGIRVSTTSGIEMAVDGSAVRQAVLLLLSTRPGERVMRPEYGCDLHRLIFSPNDNTSAGLAIHYVRQALERWEPRIYQIRVNAGRHPDIESRLDIEVHYRVRATQRPERISYSINLAGEAL
jgi:phage baseplate assembly protein W